MKWSIKYIVSALPFLFTACSGDWLDLDPSTSVTSDNAIQSLEDAKTALNGIYRIASEHSYYGDNSIMPTAVAKTYKLVLTKVPADVYLRTICST